MIRIPFIHFFLTASAIVLTSLLTQAQSAPPQATAAESNVKLQNEASVWEQAVIANAKNEYAWLQLYKTRRFALNTQYGRKIDRNAQDKLDDIVEQINLNLPNSFAYNYCAYLNLNKSEASFSFLEAAYALQPDNAELIDDMLCLSIIRNNVSQASSFATKLSNSGVYSAAEKDYNQNVLNSLELNTVLVTYGNVDTYPALIWQYMNNYRQDVTILCIDWLANETYRKKIASTLGINEMDLTGNDAESLVKKITSSTLRPVYLTLTLPPSVLKAFKSNLYCVGLAMKYSEVAIANLPTLQSNWETRINKNTLNQSDPINKNYVLPLLLLRNYYSDLGNETAKSQIDALLNALAANFGLQKTIEKHTD